MQKISVVLPVYNEEQIIEAFHTELSRVVSGIQEYAFEIIYVIDKSSDNTLEVLKKVADNDDRVLVVALSRRFGHQLSLVAGIDHSTGDAVIMMDSDLQHPPALIPELLKKYEEGYHIVHTKRNNSSDVSFFKGLTSNIFYKLVNVISPVKLSKSAADFRLISKFVVDVFKNKIREQNQFLRGLFHWAGFEQTIVEFEADVRTHGSSKYNLIKLISFAIDGITSFSKIPLRLSILMGSIFSAVSILYAVYALIMYMFDDSLPAGWSSLVVMISFIGGVQLIFLGVIGEYIGKIFDEVKNRPLYIVEGTYTKPNQ